MHLPGGPGVRVDTMLYTGYTLPTQYDSMVAKVIVHAPTRLEAIKRMRRALSELVIEGIRSKRHYSSISYISLIISKDILIQALLKHILDKNGE